MGAGGLACAAQAITCIEVSSGTTQSSVPVTFGQPFKAGDWPIAQGLVATDSSGTSVPIQADDISTHRDGSVRFAVLSAKVSNLNANQPKLVNFYLAAKNSSVQTVPANPDWNMELEVKVYNGTTLLSTLVAKPQDLLKQQIAQGTGRRLNGQVATEYTVVAPFKNSTTNEEHPHLSARLHTRLYESGARIRTDMVLENNWTFKPQPANITYELTVRRNGQVIHTQPKFTHYHHARWHKVLWTGATAPQYRLRHNMPYFVNSKAVWNYNLGLSVSSAALAYEAQSLAASNTKPMGQAQLTPYFPTSGSRPEIAPLPRWTVLYLLTQDDRALASMLANADAAAGVPVHYRDESTGHPLDVQTRPDVTVRYDSSIPAVPAGSGTTIWEADRSHQASFAYMPYLVTGDAFYLDETMFWASWNITMSDPGSRGRNAGLIYYEQTRGQAWSLRSIGEAAFAAPDNHYLKSYFKNVLANNMAWYGNAAQYSPIGGLNLRDYPGFLAPWQSDFVSLVYSWLAENSEPKAMDSLNLISKYQVGRFMNEANGFCPTKAMAYDVQSTDTSGQYITTWSTMFSRNFPTYAGKPCSQVPMNEEAYPSDAAGMSAMARASLASAANAGASNAASAYAKLKSMTPAMDSGFTNDPTWAIVPR